MSNYLYIIIAICLGSPLGKKVVINTSLLNSCPNGDLGSHVYGYRFGNVNYDGHTLVLK